MNQSEAKEGLDLNQIPCLSDTQKHQLFTALVGIATDPHAGLTARIEAAKVALQYGVGLPNEHGNEPAD